MQHVTKIAVGNNGYCDCGDPNVIIQEGFCPDHKGPFTNKEDLMNFIKSSFDCRNFYCDIFFT